MTLVRCCTGRLAKVARCIGDRVSRLSDPSEWLRFAQADLAASRLLLTDAELPFRLACFHAQRAAEKALKAALVQGSVEFRKTHDLVVLAGLQTDHSDRRSASLTSNCSSSGVSMGVIRRMCRTSHRSMRLPFLRLAYAPSMLSSAGGQWGRGSLERRRRDGSRSAGGLRSSGRSCRHSR